MSGGANGEALTRRQMKRRRPPPRIFSIIEQKEAELENDGGSVALSKPETRLVSMGAQGGRLRHQKGKPLTAAAAKQIAKTFPLLTSGETILNATRAFAAPGTAKHIAWDRKVKYYQSQALYSAQRYDAVDPRPKEFPFTWPMLLPAAEAGDEFNVRTLLNKNVVLPPCAKTLNAGIVRAARNGHATVVRMLLNYGNCTADAHDEIDERAQFSNRKFVALLEASQNGHDTVVAALLDRGADPHIRGSFQRNALHFSADGGYEKCIQTIAGWILADGWEHEINEPDELGKRPIHFACANGHVAAMEKLLHYGALINVRAMDQSTGLLLASKNGHPELVQSLLEHGADPHLEDNIGETPFMWALFKKHRAVVDLLLPLQTQGSALHQRNKAGDTSLITAVKYDYLEIARLLIQNGSDINASNNRGDASLHWSARNGLFEMSSVLLDAGADLMAQNKNGVTPFEIATENSKSFDFVMLFLKGGEDGDEKSFEFKRRGELALLCAAFYGRLKTAQKLIDSIRVDRNCRDTEGNTCLHLAAKSGKNETIRLLLRRGLPRHAKNDAGQTPLGVANALKLTKTEEILCLPYGSI
eukprot:g3408.t1